MASHVSICPAGRVPRTGREAGGRGPDRSRLHGAGKGSKPVSCGRRPAAGHDHAIVPSSRRGRADPGAAEIRTAAVRAMPRWGSKIVAAGQHRTARMPSSSNRCSIWPQAIAVSPRPGRKAAESHWPRGFSGTGTTPLVEAYAGATYHREPRVFTKPGHRYPICTQARTY